MPWIALAPASYAGRRIGSGQCVAYVQAACGAPHTSQWRRGMKVRGNAVAPGTAIATFDADGRYGNHTDGRSHGAILIAEEAGGLRVWDQWLGQPVHQRLIRFQGGQGGRWVNDGDRFFVIEHGGGQHELA